MKDTKETLNPQLIDPSALVVGERYHIVARYPGFGGAGRRISRQLTLNSVSDGIFVCSNGMVLMPRENEMSDQLHAEELKRFVLIGPKGTAFRVETIEPDVNWS